MRPSFFPPHSPQPPTVSCHSTSATKKHRPPQDHLGPPCQLCLSLKKHRVRSSCLGNARIVTPHPGHSDTEDSLFGLIYLGWLPTWCLETMEHPGWKKKKLTLSMWEAAQFSQRRDGGTVTITYPHIHIWIQKAATPNQPHMGNLLSSRQDRTPTSLI